MFFHGDIKVDSVFYYSFVHLIFLFFLFTVYCNNLYILISLLSVKIRFLLDLILIDFWWQVLEQIFRIFQNPHLIYTTMEYLFFTVTLKPAFDRRGKARASRDLPRGIAWLDHTKSKL